MTAATTRRFTRAAALLGIVLSLGACMEGNRLAFAPTDTDSRSPSIGGGRALTAVFGNGDLVLAAPSGFCFDAQMETHTDQGGFALLARCERMSAFFGRRTEEGALLTATVGSIARGTPPPTTDALRSVFTSNRASARVLESRGEKDLSLVKMYLDGHNADGASGVHWRGAFVIGGHLVSVALYAPEGSSYLGDKGARLIREFLSVTRNATHIAQGEPARRPAPGTAPVQAVVADPT